LQEAVYTWSKYLDELPMNIYTQVGSLNAHRYTQFTSLLAALHFLPARANSSPKYPTQNRAGGVAEVVEHLSSKHEALSSNPSTTKKIHK
jgi:hypothetical protein